MNIVLSLITTVVVTSTGLVTAEPRPSATIARSQQPNDTPCGSVNGLWLSSNFETVFEVTATGMANRSDVRAVGSDWTGAVESLFGDAGPVSAFIGHPNTGTAATFVGHCRVIDGMDTITGVWVLAAPDKEKLDYHLAVQPIPDTLYLLDVGEY